MARSGRSRAQPVLRSAHEPSGAVALLAPSWAVLASHVVETKPDRPRTLGPDAALDPSLVASTCYLSSLSFAPHGRFDLRQEPDAGNPLVRISAGGDE